MSIEVSVSHQANALGESRRRKPVRSSYYTRGTIMALISFTRVVRISAVLFTLTMLMATPALAH